MNCEGQMTFFTAHETGLSVRSREHVAGNIEAGRIRRFEHGDKQLPSAHKVVVQVVGHLPHFF